MHKMFLVLKKVMLKREASWSLFMPMGKGVVQVKTKVRGSQSAQFHTKRIHLNSRRS